MQTEVDPLLEITRLIRRDQDQQRRQVEIILGTQIQHQDRETTLLQETIILLEEALDTLMVIHREVEVLDTQEVVVHLAEAVDILDQEVADLVDRLEAQAEAEADTKNQINLFQLLFSPNNY